MKVLVACEESQAVTIELRRLGHEAYSCDVIDCSGGHPEWHIRQDVIPLLNGDCNFQTADGGEHSICGQWDMIIAFPPCTKTSNAGARHLWKNGKLNLQRYYDGLCGKALFMTILAADCNRIAVENPTPSKIYEFPLPTQIIQPYEFGHPYSKRTLLWLKGLPTLHKTNVVKMRATWCPSSLRADQHRGMFSTDRARNRSKTFPGVAKAMAEQWAGQAFKEAKHDAI